MLIHFVVECMIFTLSRVLNFQVDRVYIWLLLIGVFLFDLGDGSLLRYIRV